ncbi:hypothetical protein LJ754_10375 [Arthrobacter sp. zg-Y40]|uniref:hypothetical protein n=1 Tax=Arthrobacter sp. zg-Y40 TaxID=2886939 RepID=UPI001D14611C|nr:hypothetical protein [Arthrobacter sp. zg-Y40]MCC3279554.1 hypothetical protein [Arthrobacter sp. zg-Y40]
MPANDRDPIPLAFRATAYMRPSLWRRRPVRAFRYDVLWKDGRVDRDIDLVKVMYRQAPADYQVTERAMLEQCPETGAGQWVAYASGYPVDGPA